MITNNYSSAIGTTSLITSISVDQPPFGLIVYQNTGGAKFTLSNTDIHKIDLQLFDEDFNYINFNNINWSILFCLHLTYRMPIPQISRQINDKLQPSEFEDSRSGPDNPKYNSKIPRVDELNFLNS